MLVFLVFLLLAVQVVFALYARSTVTAVAYDGARIVAGSEGQVDEGAARERAESHARRLLGRYGEEATFAWGDDADAVVLTVEMDNPGFLPASLRRPMGLDRTSRTARVHREVVVRAR